MADTVAVMNKGRIEQMGAPEVLYELPETTFVANFLGQSNLFTGTVAESTDELIAVEVAGRRIAVPKRRAKRHAGETTVGVRPEKLSLHSEEPVPSSGRNVLGPGRIVDISFAGVSTQYLLAVPGLGTVVVFAQNIGLGARVALDSDAWVSWDVEHGFGLADDPAGAPRFVADTSTQSIAAQKRDALRAELEGA